MCDQCGEPWHLNGPIWISELNDQSFVQRLLDNLGLLEKAEREGEDSLPADLRGLKIKTKKEIRGVLEYIQ